MKDTVLCDQKVVSDHKHLKKKKYLFRKTKLVSLTLYTKSKKDFRRLSR